MNRDTLEKLIIENYNSVPEHPWLKYPEDTVFRRADNRKWFAVILDVRRDKLGLSGDGMLTVANFKCETLLIDALVTEPGLFRGYHMNKNNWISAALDGTVPDERIKMLLDMSYNTTAKKLPRRKE